MRGHSRRGAERGGGRAEAGRQHCCGVAVAMGGAGRKREGEGEEWAVA